MIPPDGLLVAALAAACGLLAARESGLAMGLLVAAAVVTALVAVLRGAS